MNKENLKYTISPEHVYNGLQQENIARLNIKFQILFGSISIAGVLMTIAIESENPFTAFVTPLLLLMIWLIDRINSKYHQEIFKHIHTDFDEGKSNYKFEQFHKIGGLTLISIILSTISIAIGVYYLG